mmetsp:Transcript_397/g.725  ORF Transcript_397/g.725 Transcript_397/m.725 type:complete len:219 (-) Transcript_397:140-796(-)
MVAEDFLQSSDGERVITTCTHFVNLVAHVKAHLSRKILNHLDIELSKRHGLFTRRARRARIIRRLVYSTKLPERFNINVLKASLQSLTIESYLVSLEYVSAITAHSSKISRQLPFARCAKRAADCSSGTSPRSLVARARASFWSSEGRWVRLLSFNDNVSGICVTAAVLVLTEGVSNALTPDVWSRIAELAEGGAGLGVPYSIGKGFTLELAMIDPLR